MAVYRGYEGAKSCTGGPQPGSLGMMQWFRAKYAHLGGTNLGIYECRKIAGSSTLSIHSEGRAVDFGINPHGASYGTDLATRLQSKSKELGIQCIIWNRKIWSGSRPDGGWQKYTGKNPHVDHLHVELSWKTAKMSAAEIIKLLEKHVGSAPIKQTPRDPVLRRGSTGPAVRQLQSLLNSLGFSVGAVDGSFGPMTEKSVRRFQQARGLEVDGIVGPKTWADLRKPSKPRPGAPRPV